MRYKFAIGMKIHQMEENSSTWDYLREKMTISTGFNPYYLRSILMGISNQWD